jgi:alpha-ribazole phosphatase
MSDTGTTLWLWRHPRAVGAAGRCIGRTDLSVDRRRAKRLAHRVRHAARRHRWPRVVFTSPSTRCAAVGGWLAHWGWRHVIDARLLELDFGRWDGLPWTQIDPREVAVWEADLLHHAPGGHESLADVLRRVESFCRDTPGSAVLIAHAGWVQAAALYAVAAGSAAAIDASRWPASPAHGSLRRVHIAAGGSAPTIEAFPSADHTGGAVPPCPDSMNSQSGSSGSCSDTRS